jgi:hypothetical protein
LGWPLTGKFVTDRSDASGLRRFAPAVTGDFIELGRILPTSRANVVGTFTWCPVTITNRIAYSRNRTSAETGIAEEIVALFLLGTDRVVSAWGRALHPLRFPAAPALWIGCFVAALASSLVLQILVRHCVSIGIRRGAVRYVDK